MARGENAECIAVALQEAGEEVLIGRRGLRRMSDSAGGIGMEGLLDLHLTHPRSPEKFGRGRKGHRGLDRGGEGVVRGNLNKDSRAAAAQTWAGKPMPLSGPGG